MMTAGGTGEAEVGGGNEMPDGGAVGEAVGGGVLAGGVPPEFRASMAASISLICSVMLLMAPAAAGLAPGGGSVGGVDGGTSG